MINNLSESLNGKFDGLYGEVVTEDVYKFKELRFTPSVVIDMGANVGTASRFIRELFPDCLIVAIEPNPSNLEVFKQFTKDGNLILIEKAIGTGKVYHGLTAANGSGETYLSNSEAFPENKMLKDNRMESCEVQTIRLSEIISKYVYPFDKLVIKMDIEGNENSLFFDPIEMAALRRADYLAAEVHRYALTSNETEKVNKQTAEALLSLQNTHYCVEEGVHFYATKF